MQQQETMVKAKLEQTRAKINPSLPKTLRVKPKIQKQDVNFVTEALQSIYIFYSR